MNNIHVDFGHVVKGIKRNEKYTRECWSGKGMHIELQRPHEFSKMTLPYIFLSTPNEVPHTYSLVPWLPSQTDMLAEDWVEVNPDPA